MAFTHRNTQGTSSESAGSITITKPTNLAVGDLMVAVIGKDDDPAIDTVPSGWSTADTNGTTTGNDVRSGFYYKVADAADVAASNFTWSGDAGEDMAGAISAFIPGNSNPAYVDISTHVLRSGDTTPASNALTTTAGNLLVGGCVAAQADTGGLGVNSPFVEPVNGSQTTGAGNGDNAAIIAYVLSGGGGSQSAEFNNAEAGAESHPVIMEFSDDAAAGSVMPHLWKFATGV